MHRDVTGGHGDVVQLVNAAGTVTRDYRYDAWGNQAETAEEDTNPFRYAGEYFDTETGNIYLRARYYDTSTGRFISEDPHWNPGNMIYGDDGNNGVPDIAAVMQSGNLYGYCGNNPVNRIDNSGILGKALIYICRSGHKNALRNLQLIIIMQVMFVMSLEIL